MDLKRFRQLLAEFGPDIEIWPARERAAARHMLVASTEAAAAHQQAVRADELLASGPSAGSPLSVDPAAVERVLDRLARMPLPAPAGVPVGGLASLGRPYASVALLVSLAVAGFVVGLADLAPGTESTPAFELFGVFPGSDVTAGFGL